VVADWSDTPQPRSTTQVTPMFHGPNGRLGPMPDRIRYASVPRTSDRPGMTTQNRTPQATQAMKPKIEIWTNWMKVSAARASLTSL